MTRKKALKVSHTLTELEELEDFIESFNRFSEDFSPDYGDYITSKIDTLLAKEKNKLLNKIKSF